MLFMYFIRIFSFHESYLKTINIKWNGLFCCLLMVCISINYCTAQYLLSKPDISVFTHDWFQDIEKLWTAISKQSQIRLVSVIIIDSQKVYCLQSQDIAHDIIQKSKHFSRLCWVCFLVEVPTVGIITCWNDVAKNGHGNGLQILIFLSPCLAPQ